MSFNNWGFGGFENIKGTGGFGNLGGFSFSYTKTEIEPQLNIQQSAYFPVKTILSEAKASPDLREKCNNMLNLASGEKIIVCIGNDIFIDSPYTIILTNYARYLKFTLTPPVNSLGPIVLSKYTITSAEYYFLNYRIPDDKLALVKNTRTSYILDIIHLIRDQLLYQNCGDIQKERDEIKQTKEKLQKIGYRLNEEKKKLASHLAISGQIDIDKMLGF